MTRQRKAKETTSVPLVQPSKAPIRPVPAKPLIELDEEEQWRIINQSGILNNPGLKASKLSTAAKSPPSPEEDAELSLGDEIFNAILLIIPFSSILLLMEILIRHQYGKEVTMDVIMDRMVSGIPILSLFIFYTNRYKSHRRIQTLMCSISLIVGTRMLWQYRNASWLVNLKQCPPLATIWIYTIVQLDLELAVTSLMGVGLFVWWKDIQIL